MKITFSLLTVLSLGLVALVAAEQNEIVATSADRAAQATEATLETPDETLRVSLSEDGVLSGTVFQNVDDRQQPVAAKVTISKLNGDAIQSETANEDGTFEFEAIEPGYYTIVGVGPGYFGDQIIDVAPHGDAYAATVPVEVSQAVDPGAVFAEYQDVPVQTFATDSCGWNCSGCAGGGVSSGRGGGKLRRLLPLAGLVGLVGLSDDDDASPDM